MDEDAARAALERLIIERGCNYGALSRLIGRNAAYIQQYIKRGTPRKLDEDDRRTLARFFDVPEAELGSPAGEKYVPQRLDSGRSRFLRDGAMAIIPRLALGVSAGLGSLDDDERVEGVMGVDPQWLRKSGLHQGSLSILSVDGDSMAPTLADGDDIMVDRDDNILKLRDGIYVLRFDNVLMVKRVAVSPGKHSATGMSARAMTISSDNPHYPTWENVDRTLIDVVGRVVWAGRRIT